MLTIHCIQVACESGHGALEWKVRDLEERPLRAVAPAGNGGSKPISLGIVNFEPRETKHNWITGGSDYEKLNLFAMITINH